MKIQIAIAIHKPYPVPSGSLYLPVQAGAAIHDPLGFERDDTGENISRKNPWYCELSVLYWCWKHLEADYIGLVHYRRYFRGNQADEKTGWPILQQAEIEDLLSRADVILPQHRNYVIETVGSHYAHTHYREDLIRTRTVLQNLYPDYVEYFDRHLKSRSSHMFNMFIMPKPVLDGYCSFLFSILDQLEPQVPLATYSEFQARVFGRISELLLDIWLEKNGITWTEVPVYNTEPVKWPRKISSFLAAKFFGRKYTGSF